jgi:hypothetical protein
MKYTFENSEVNLLEFELNPSNEVGRLLPVSNDFRVSLLIECHIGHKRKCPC